MSNVTARPRTPPAILFPQYTSDGPGYAGPVAVQIGGATACCFLARDQHEGKIFAVQFNTPELPTVVASRPAVQEDAQTIWDHMGPNSRLYCTEPTDVDTDRCAMVTWSDGSAGAVVIWGEPFYVSAISFDGFGKGDHLLDFKWGESSIESYVDREVLAALLPEQDAVQLHEILDSQSFRPYEVKIQAASVERPSAR